jgi:hypothetical protein
VTVTPSYPAASPSSRNLLSSGNFFRAHPEQETISAVRTTASVAFVARPARRKTVTRKLEKERLIIVCAGQGDRERNDYAELGGEVVLK